LERPLLARNDGSSGSLAAFQAYGLTIASAIPLPELPSANGAVPDVVIRIGAVDTGSALPAAGGSFLSLGSNDACVVWEQVGAFRVREGREITVDPAPGVLDQTIRNFLLGTVMGVLLHQRGLLVLHASAVAVAGKAAGFLGHRGMGKSTLAAACVARGLPLVVDDVLAVEFEEAIPTVWPGFPQLKLWPASAEAALQDVPDDLPRLHPTLDKRLRSARDRFQADALPLGPLYILAVGDSARVERLSPAEAAIELVRYSFCTSMLAGGDATQHLKQCAVLARSGMVRRLTRGPHLAELASLAELVEQDAATA